MDRWCNLIGDKGGYFGGPDRDDRILCIPEIWSVGLCYANEYTKKAIGVYREVYLSEPWERKIPEIPASDTCA